MELLFLIGFLGTWIGLSIALYDCRAFIWELPIHKGGLKAQIICLLVGLILGLLWPITVVTFLTYRMAIKH
jgi:hypothetical protein